MLWDGLVSHFAKVEMEFAAAWKVQRSVGSEDARLRRGILSVGGVSVFVLEGFLGSCSCTALLRWYMLE
jgi:hypothetical protein